MKKILINQCLQCWHCDDDTYHCRETGEKIINPYVIPADCPLEDDLEQKLDLPESKGSDGWIPVSERLPEVNYHTATDSEQKYYQKGYEQGVSHCSLYLHDKIQDSISSTAIHGCFDDAIHGRKLTDLIESFPIEFPAVPQEKGDK